MGVGGGIQSFLKRLFSVGDNISSRYNEFANDSVCDKNCSFFVAPRKSVFSFFLYEL